MRGRWRTGRLAGLAGLAAALVMGGGLGALAGPGAASAAACPAWDGTQPADPASGDGSNFLRGVAVVSACDAWMVGHYEPAAGGEQTLIERWTGGPDWTVTPSPSPGQYPGVPAFTINDLWAVAAVSATDAWAVGQYSDGNADHGLVLHWDGSRWTQVTVPGGSRSLGGISARSANDVWVTGTDTAGAALLLHYDGSGWTPYSPGTTPSGASITMSGMTATSASDVWAVGSYTVGFSSFEHTLTLHWDGSQWSQIPSPVTTPPDDDLGTRLLSVSATSPSDAWAVGDADEGASTAILHWDGHSWAVVPSPDPADDPSGFVINILHGVAAVSPDSAFAVGGYGNEHNGAASEFQTMLLHWDGRRWAQVPSPSPGTVLNTLQGVAVSPVGLVWAAGYGTDRGFSAYRAAAAAFGVVPGVVGEIRAVAVDAMDNAGLHAVVTTVTTAGGGCGPSTNGTVLAVSPPAGTFTGHTVSLTVCDFPPVVTVPSVVGLADSQAQGTLTNAGLTAGSVTLSGNCTFDPGTVLRQTPAAGSTVSRGTAVNLTEATIPKPHGCAQ